MGRQTTVFRQLKNNPPGNFEGLGLEPQYKKKPALRPVSFMLNLDTSSTYFFFSTGDISRDFNNLYQSFKQVKIYQVARRDIALVVVQYHHAVGF